MKFYTLYHVKLSNRVTWNETDLLPKKISGLTGFKHGICILFSKITKKMFHVFITFLLSL